MADRDYVLAEFKGTYRSPHPQGFQSQNILKSFHVKVKMKRNALKAPGLNGLFATYYVNFLHKAYPDMVELYMFNLVQATELDGSEIRDPKALSYDGLLKYIAEQEIPINAGLYPPHELRNEVILYLKDPEGQQSGQTRLGNMKGAVLEVSAELQELDDVLQIVDDSQPAPVAVKAGKPAGKPAGKQPVHA